MGRSAPGSANDVRALLCEAPPGAGWRDGWRATELRRFFVAIFVWLGMGVVAAMPGALDPTFGDNGKSIIRPDAGAALEIGAAMTTGGHVAFAGTAYLGVNFFPYLGVLSPLGRLDPATSLSTLGRNGETFLHAVATYPDGSFVAAGSCYSGGYLTKADQCLARRRANGLPDSTWNAVGVISASLSSGYNGVGKVFVQSDGSIVAAGSCMVPGRNYDFCVSRYLPDGTLDTSFNSTGIVLTSIGPSADQATGAALQADGKLVVGGKCSNGTEDRFCVVRYHTNGTLDDGFGNGGARIIELEAGNYSAFDVTLDGSGRILLAGACPGALNARRYCVLRLNTDATNDTTFATAGALYLEVAFPASAPGMRLAVQPDGKLVVAATCAQTPGLVDVCVTRHLPDGASDTAFAQTGLQRIDFAGGMDRVGEVLLQHDGKILITGICDNTTGSAYCFVRLKGGPYEPATCMLDVDGDSRVDSTTDGVLILRYLFGLRNQALVGGVAGQSSGRTAVEIEGLLADLFAQGKLDADGDGQSLAMTDGLLILRAMLGLTGGALTAGAANTAHPGVRDAQQVLHWIENTHGVACLP